MKREPITSFEQFVKSHEALDRAIWRHHVSAAGKNKLSPEMLSKLMKQNAANMSAINPHTRIAYAKSADHFIRQRIRTGELSDVFFVDIACEKHIASISEIQNFDLGALAKWMQRRLKGMSFFGALDAAYYYNGTPLTDKKEPAVCWHGHFMVWGVTRAKLLKRQTKTNERFKAGWAGGQCFYFKGWPENVDGRAMYMMKAPQSEYSVFLYEQPDDTFDSETGEIVEGKIEKAKQYKRELRPGSFKNVVELYSRVHMGDILLANGDGRRLLTDIVDHAKELLSRDRERQQAAKAEIIGLPKDSWPASARSIEPLVSPVIKSSSAGGLG
ncbi:MAG: hypothetical protein AAGD15_02000 [Agrobacterium cavarae]|uniref:hypothetical protein n=1 Tax=Agrobacterium cavarae TaxID=2528239 RepID=UPI0031AA9DEC